MGFDPLTVGLGISAASGIYNAFQGNKAQKAAQHTADQNYAAQQQAYGAAQAANQQHNQFLQNLIMPELNGSSFNTGQDGMMQQMRGLPDGRIGTTGFLDAIRKLSAQDLGDQLSQQRGAVGSLGQRFGTAQGNIEARLRERAITGLNAQYGQFAQQQQQNRLGLLSLLAGQQPFVNMGVPTQTYVPPQGGGLGEAIGNIGNMALLYPYLRDGAGGGGGGTPPIMPGGIGYGGSGGIPGSLFGGGIRL